MRINVITGPFLPPPPAPCGAVERVWADLADEFARRGHRVTVLHKSHEAIPPGRNAAGVVYIPVPGFASCGRLATNLPLDAVYTARALMRAPRADITVTNTFWAPVLARARREWLGPIHVQVQRVPKGQFRLYAAAGADRFAAVSGYIADCLRRQCPGAADRVRTFANPIRTEVFRPDPAPLRRPGSIIYAGRLHPEKGVHVLLEAIRILAAEDPGRGINLRLAGAIRLADGGGGAAYAAQLRRLADGLPVRFLGPIYDRAAFARFLGSARVFCYPSLAEQGEAFGIAPLEAMACGTPVVLSQLAVFRDFFDEGAHGLTFDHRDEGAQARHLANALRRMLDLSDHDRAAMGARCADRGAMFSIAAVADRYLADFEELAGGHR